MKIVYLYPELLYVAGTDRVIIQKSNYFSEVFNYEIFIVTTHQNALHTDHNIPFFNLSKNVKHIDLDINFHIQYKHNLFIRAFIYFRLLHIYKKKLSKLLMDISPDFVITTMNRDLDILPDIKDGSFKIAESHLSKPYLKNFA